jgi:hypothetical protein
VAKAKVQAMRELGVSFGSVAVQKESIGVRLKASRGVLTVGAADQLLCGKRLQVSLLARASGGPGQASLPGLDDDTKVEGLADVKSYGVSPRFISFTLSFVLDADLREKLTKLAGLEGMLAVLSSDKIPDDARGGDDDE